MTPCANRAQRHNPGLFSIVALAVATSTSADTVRIFGHGNPRSECYVALDVTGRKEQLGCEQASYRSVSTESGGVRVEQESCGDECEFNVRLCQNVGTPECTPTDIKSIDVIGGALGRPQVVGSEYGCAAAFDRVPIKLRRHQQSRTLRLKLNARGVGRPHRDHDVVTLVCTRSSRSCCGDGVVEEDEGEECDGAPRSDGVECDDNCRWRACGNCVRTIDEACEDGNGTNGDDCDENCTLPRCGNGVVALDEYGEQEECDTDPKAPNTCRPGWACNARCKCEDPTPCQCLDGQSKRLPEDDLLTIEVGQQSGSCGSATDGLTPPAAKIDIDCGTLYVGGGSRVGLQNLAVNTGATLMTTATCNGNTISLSPAGGTAKGCTGPGCLFGPPIPVAGDSSYCMLVSFASGVTGTVDCSWNVRASLQLQTDIYFPGCPICLSESGRAVDCDTSHVSRIATLKIPSFDFSTGHTESTPEGGEFATYCRDANKCFAGDACDVQTIGPIECTEPSKCAAPFTSCTQKDPGAFSNPAITAIRLTGTAPTDLGNGTSRDATMVGIFDVPPSFVDKVDLYAGIPGPGAIGLKTALRLQPASAVPAP